MKRFSTSFKINLYLSKNYVYKTKKLLIDENIEHSSIKRSEYLERTTQEINSNAFRFRRIGGIAYQ
jgi:hypothetical protein